MKKLLIILTLLTSIHSSAQESLNRSLMWSLIPGGGQVSAEIDNQKLNGYSNQHWWRGPLYFGAVSTSTYFVVKNQIQMNSRRNEWRKRLDVGLQSDQLNPAYGNLDNASLHNEFLYFQGRRNAALVSGIFFYVVSFIDAYASHKIVREKPDRVINFNSHYSDLGMEFGCTIALK